MCVVDRRHRAPRRRHADRLGRRVQRDPGLVAAGQGREPLLDERGRVLGRERARCEPDGERRGLVDAVDAERAPVVSGAVPAHEVPAASAVHQRVRFDVAAAGGPVARLVREAHALVVAARGGEHGQALRVDGRSRRGERGGGRAERLHAPPQVPGQHLLELHQRAHGGLLDPGHRRPRRRPQADRDRDRLVVVEQQRRHRRPGGQPVAAGRAGERLDRIAEPAQPLDVAPDRAARHLEPLRQLASRPVAAGLEERQQGEQAARGHRGQILT